MTDRRPQPPARHGAVRDDTCVELNPHGVRDRLRCTSAINVQLLTELVRLKYFVGAIRESPQMLSGVTSRRLFRHEPCTFDRVLGQSIQQFTPRSLRGQAERVTHCQTSAE